MPQPAQVTAAEISRLAGVTRATVSNWRRRHPDFPAPSGGTDTSPAYDLDAVRAWLAARGQLPDRSPADELRTALRTSSLDLTHRSRLLTLVVAAGRVADTVAEKAAGLPDGQLTEWARQTIRAYAEDIPGTGELAFLPDEAELLRTLLRCVAAEGAEATLKVFVEYGDTDTKTTSAYVTPAPVADLMADLISAPGEAYPETVFDPACGVGSLLLAAADHGARALYGQEYVPLVAAQAAALLAVRAGGTRAQVRDGDSIRADAFPELSADAVLCAPPYGQRDWGHEDLAYDPRWVFGLPPRAESELAWLQHCLAHLSVGGRAALLMPPGSALRPSGRRVRAELLRSGTLRAVVALPVGAAQPLHIGLQVWLLEQLHPQAALPSSVLFVDAAALGTAGTGTAGDGTAGTGTAGDGAAGTGAAGDGAAGRRVPDWPALHEAVLAAWRDFDRHPDAFDPVPAGARAVPVIDLLDESVDLTPARHVRAAPVPAKPDELAATAYELRSRLRQAASGLLTLGGGDQNWPPAGVEPVSWRTASVADLLRGDALMLLRATATAGRSAPDEEIVIEAGDVLLPELLHEGAGGAWVADAHDAGRLLGRHQHLLRADSTRFDPWFLAGFLSAEDNMRAASSGTSVVRVDARRLRVPLLSLAEQQRYGAAFRRLAALRTAADVAHRLAEETARTLAAGLTGGALLPPESPPLPQAAPPARSPSPPVSAPVEGDR